MLVYCSLVHETMLTEASSYFESASAGDIESECLNGSPDDDADRLVDRYPEYCEGIDRETTEVSIQIHLSQQKEPILAAIDPFDPRTYHY